VDYQELSRHAECADWAKAEKSKVDVVNMAILAKRQAGLDSRTGIDVGDIVLSDDVLRVTHDWGDSVQLTYKGHLGSFYLGGDGFVDFSGSLDSAIDKFRFADTGEKRDAPVWFFSGNNARAHNGFHTSAMFRVWRLD
jgi:hypothetical protein